MEADGYREKAPLLLDLVGRLDLAPAGRTGVSLAQRLRASKNNKNVISCKNMTFVRVFDVQVVLFQYFPPSCLPFCPLRAALDQASRWNHALQLMDTLPLVFERRALCGFLVQI